MDITILGTGNMARGIAVRALAGGHAVTLLGTRADKAQALAGELSGDVRPDDRRARCRARPAGWRAGGRRAGATVACGRARRRAAARRRSRRTSANLFVKLGVSSRVEVGRTSECARRSGSTRPARI
jgi:hypothetical protein